MLLALVLSCLVSHRRIGTPMEQLTLQSSSLLSPVGWTSRRMTSSRGVAS